MTIKYRVLEIEKRWTTPFFYLSWFICGAWYAIVGGRNMARAEDEDEKTALLDALHMDCEAVKGDKADEPVHVG